MEVASLIVLFILLVHCICGLGGKQSLFSNVRRWKSSGILPASDLSDSERSIWIVTTAALPWMTGTAINPLLRAAYLASDRPHGKVHLLIPWIPKAEQDFIFRSIAFDSPSEQKDFIVRWLTEEAKLDSATVEKINIEFYNASYHKDFHSIFPSGDLLSLIPDNLADVCFLEEPEHLNWFRTPFITKSWTEKFRYVIGIIHTNYVMYSRSSTLGHVKTPLLYFLNQGICRAYCHRIIKLSSALQDFAPEKEIVSNVHGVRSTFLSEEMRSKAMTKGAYFIGKLAWQKGLDQLITLSRYANDRLKRRIPIDIYGSGPHAGNIRDVASAAGLDINFYSSVDHGQLAEYRVLVNPSVTEVLCTTIAEALAMGKWVICADHPSNEFFKQFPNCLTFRTKEEFVANLLWAMNHEPASLEPSHRHLLSWEAATDRLLAAALMTKKQFLDSTMITDRFMMWLLESLGKGSNNNILMDLSRNGSTWR